MVQCSKAKGGREIPIPQVKDVPTYCLEYLPTFREPPTYIRGRGQPQQLHSGCKLCRR